MAILVTDKVNDEVFIDHLMKLLSLPSMKNLILSADNRIRPFPSSEDISEYLVFSFISPICTSVPLN
ncbi:MULTISPECIES: hypothetical protein [spotted fever group]|uniref:Uncharacterized protein n=1 Tax=Rickettsia rhipicephali str. Ect TaxID=1359199 RepID=A0A0F3PFM1_RICRH|nr:MULTISPECIES: hypothetical protein [spotted fever group]KJV79063.1 hypothetical protein RMAECT_0980 [Rickettsia rhipicephali str. Ect]